MKTNLYQDLFIIFVSLVICFVTGYYVISAYNTEPFDLTLYDICAKQNFTGYYSGWDIGFNCSQIINICGTLV